MLLLEEDTTKKEQVDKNMTKFEAGNSENYKLEVIWDSAVYVNKIKGYLLGLYYLVA